MPRRWKLFLLIVPVCVAADQGTKLWARAALAGDSGRVPFIDGYWDWFLTANTGVAFSLMSGSRLLLTAIAIVAICAISWLVHKTRDDQRMLTVALALMAGGALGNLIDRVALGSVTDFILWHYKDRYWPVFNVADVVLVLAVALFAVSSFRDHRRQRADTARA